jgi:pentatricopeptide repeat protein
MISYSQTADLRGVMREMQEAGISPDAYSWSALIKSCEHPPHIRGVMDEMREAGVEPNVATWTLLMRSHKHPEEMREVMDEMVAAGVTPDAVSYSTLISSYMREDSAEEVIAIYESHLLKTPSLINNYIVTAVLRALAATGSKDDITSFWNMYSERLTRKDFKLLSDLSMKPYNFNVAGVGWGAVRALLSTIE